MVLCLKMTDDDFLNFISKTERDYPSLVLDICTKEQIRFRMYICQECFKNNKCKVCSCSPYDTFIEKFSCNNEEFFPNRMNKWKWEEFKQNHNLMFE
jgi:hypothetical protein